MIWIIYFHGTYGTPNKSFIEIFNRWIFHVFFTIQRATGVLPWLWKPPSINPLNSDEHPQHPPGWRCCEGQGFHQGFDMLHNHPQICGCCFFSWSVFAIFIQCSDEVSGEVVLSNEQKRNKTLLKSTFDGYDANIHTDQWDPTVLYIHDGSRTIMISSPMMWAFMAFPDLCKRLQACTLW